MAKHLVAGLRSALRDPDAIRLDGFGILKSISSVVNEAKDNPELANSAQELVLRALDRREHFGAASPLLDCLLREQGLFPYLEPDGLSFADRLAYEVHRPDNLEGGIVFHTAQARVYSDLVQGKNVILSAPTSFGKSLIIDAMLATGRYNNVVVIVPTIALIDETRRRLFEKFGGTYKIITHLGQERQRKNVFVLTQERVVDVEDLRQVDFFVIDEFYKLDPRSDPERAALLNQAFYRLARTGAQFYLLGPNIRGIPDELPNKFECSFVSTDYATVVTESTRVRVPPADKSAALVALCAELSEPTLIYCASPASTRKVALAMLAGGIGRRHDELGGAVEWIAEQFHPEWIFVRALERGIGIHHGRLPRALAQLVVRLFNDGLLDVLVCTSTLIEGVNTKAKNVVIYDHKIATKNLDFFTFNNIRGRSGRMGHHVIGRVFLFSDPPQEDFPEIDVPMVTQDESASDSLLIQLHEEDLSEGARERVRSYREQSVLDLAVLRANKGIEPALQLRLAEELADSAEHHWPLLRWSGMPTYEELERACVLIWDYLVPDNRMRAGVASGRQLAFRINRFRQRPDIREFILSEVSDDDDPDDAVEGALEFLRFWVSYNFPRYLMALGRIQTSVYGRLGLTSGDYSVFAAQVENFFLPGGVVALDEYGIPLQVGAKLSSTLGDPETLDGALKALRSLDVARTSLAPFEAQLVRDTQQYV